jgi:ATP-dependent Clp protease, protease subunit
VKFYEFKNITNEEASLYIYGAIVTDKDGWFSSESDVSLAEFKQALDDLGDFKTLNMYINSPGGEVFVASTMVSMLKRVKDKGVTINAFVDGLSASAASFLMMIADNINLYSNSVVMIHKPMSIAMGNSNDFQQMIDILDKLEDSIMIPMYLEKAIDGVDEQQIKDLIAAESWFGAKDMAKYFNVTLLDESKNVKAMIDKNLFKNYKNAPKDLVEEEIIEELTEHDETNEQITPTIDEVIEKKQKEIVDNNIEIAKMLLELEI